MRGDVAAFERRDGVGEVVRVVVDERADERELAVDQRRHGHVQRLLADPDEDRRAARSQSLQCGR
jgi:hypothetical protein